MLQIKCAEDFGLGFNCMSRLYMDHFDEEILQDMIKISEEYLHISVKRRPRFASAA